MTSTSSSSANGINDSRSYLYQDPKKLFHSSSPSTIPPNSICVLATAPVNIAVIKYWGKRDTQLILPSNSSLSCTLDTSTMCSTTLIIANKTFKQHIFILNGQKQPLTHRILTVLNQLQSHSNDYIHENTGDLIVSKDEWKHMYLHIISSNNFPTAAGLASSASGFACLTKALASLYNFNESYPNELTTYARQGSGSACRSLDGGWVVWWDGKQNQQHKDKNDNVNGQDDAMNDESKNSYAEQVVNESYWSDMRVMILVASSKQKEVGSTEGMQLTVQTSDFLKHRCTHIVPTRLNQMIDAIKQRDFPTFAELTIRDSNSFHATCLDTYPPIFYLNDTSKSVINLVNVYNQVKQQLTAAYTFDAGPNAVIYCLKHDLPTLLYITQQYYGTSVPIHDPTRIQYESHEPKHSDNGSSVDKNLAKQVLEELKSKEEHISLNEIILTMSGEGAVCQGRKVT